MGATVGSIASAALGKMVVKGLAMSIGAGILVEGAALSGAKALKENQATAAKVAKYALGVIALIGSLSATVGLGVSASLFVDVVFKGASLGKVVGAFVALGTLHFHWKAFQWSGLVVERYSFSIEGI